MLISKRTQEEIDEVLNRCADAVDEGTRYRGATYEEGVEAAIRWLFDTGIYEGDFWPFTECTDDGLLDITGGPIEGVRR